MGPSTGLQYTSTTRQDDKDLGLSSAHPPLHQGTVLYQVNQVNQYSKTVPGLIYSSPNQIFCVMFLYDKVPLVPPRCPCLLSYKICS